MRRFQCNILGRVSLPHPSCKNFHYLICIYFYYSDTIIKKIDFQNEIIVKKLPILWKCHARQL